LNNLAKEYFYLISAMATKIEKGKNQKSRKIKNREFRASVVPDTRIYSSRTGKFWSFQYSDPANQIPQS
jgi:hypothetical protein